MDVTPEDLAGKVVAKLYADDSPMSPDDFDHAGTLTVLDRDFGLSDQSDYLPIEPNGYSRDKEWRIRFAERYFSMAGGVAIPVRFDDYGSSGARIYTTDADSANGLISVDKKEIEKEWAGDKTAARSYLESRITEMNQYLSGDVYGYVIETPDGDDLDSCWGFYGQQYATEEAIEAARHCASAEQSAQHFAAQHDIPTIAKES
jgi:hypothetical protein